MASTRKKRSKRRSIPFWPALAIYAAVTLLCFVLGVAVDLLRWLLLLTGATDVFVGIGFIAYVLWAYDEEIFTVFPGILGWIINLVNAPRTASCIMLIVFGFVKLFLNFRLARL